MNKLKEYWIDILFILLAIIPSSYAFFYDFHIHISENKEYWFQRSGSLMVIFAIALDSEQAKYIERKESSTFYIGTPIVLGKELSRSRSLIQKFSIVLMITGTIIWGYGDLCFK